MPKTISVKVPAPASRDAPACMTLAQFCALYGVGRSYVYLLMHSGALRAVKAGKRTLVRRADAEAWLASLPSAAFGKAA